jgi:hypothetical protein
VRFLLITLLATATSASAQINPGATKNPPAPATKQETKAPVTQQDTKAADTKTTGTKAPAAAQRGAGLTIAPEAPATRTKVPEIMREAYDYDAGGRRDPFFSLMGSADLRPTVTDLKLTGVLYHATRPIAILRDITTNTQYRVTLGSQLGRMRVVLIRPRVVIFTIEEFGLNRRDSLFLGDTSKVRAR